jgi:hypothetical protein
VAAFVLSGVLLAAGLAKLLDLWGIRLTVRELLPALPRALTHVLAICLVILELASATALIVFRPPFALAGAIAVAALALSFAAAVLLARRLPYPVACRCFGRLSRSALSGRTLLTAVLMLAGAVIVALNPAPGNLSGFAAYQLRLLAVLPALVILASRLRQRSSTPRWAPGSSRPMTGTRA